MNTVSFPIDKDINILGPLNINDEVLIATVAPTPGTSNGETSLNVFNPAAICNIGLLSLGITYAPTVNDRRFQLDNISFIIESVGASPQGEPQYRFRLKSDTRRGLAINQLPDSDLVGPRLRGAKLLAMGNPATFTVKLSSNFEPWTGVPILSMATYELIEGGDVVTMINSNGVSTFPFGGGPVCSQRAQPICANACSKGIIFIPTKAFFNCGTKNPSESTDLGTITCISSCALAKNASQTCSSDNINILGVCSTSTTKGFTDREDCCAGDAYVYCPAGKTCSDDCKTTCPTSGQVCFVDENTKQFSCSTRSVLPCSTSPTGPTGTNGPTGPTGNGPPDNDGLSRKDIILIAIVTVVSVVFLMFIIFLVFQHRSPKKKT